MNKSRQLLAAALVVVAVLAVLSAAFAAGEPKNQAPFGRALVSGQQAIRGEPKNELPFTRPLFADPIAGEPKDVPPFTRRLGSRRAASRDWFERFVAAHPYGHDPD
jgi:hypothetical protein